MAGEDIKGSVLAVLKSYFQQYTGELTSPTKKKFVWLCITIIVVHSVPSIRFLYRWFLKPLVGSSLNSLYHMLGYSNLNLRHFMLITVKFALSCIPVLLHKLPVFLIVDDTLQEKFGIYFESCKTMFDHVKRTGSSYLNGHCFVGICLKVPVILKKKVHYLTIPIGYRLRNDDQSKLVIVSEMIRQIMPLLQHLPMVILLCDSWYPKGAVVKLVSGYENLELIASVRKDTVMHKLPPKKTGRRGRPRKKGQRLDVHNPLHFSFGKIGKYFIATRAVMTNLFSTVVYATVTTPNQEVKGSYRLFISTVMPKQLEQMLKIVENELMQNLPPEKKLVLLPYALYSFRWSIEVVFYEHKTFWSFGKYMLRKASGIENYVNLINICYSCMKILPFVNKKFASLQGESPQTIKYLLSQQIQCEMFFDSFVSTPEKAKKQLVDFSAFVSEALKRMAC